MGLMKSPSRDEVLKGVPGVEGKSIVDEHDSTQARSRGGAESYAQKGVVRLGPSVSRGSSSGIGSLPERIGSLLRGISALLR